MWKKIKAAANLKYFLVLVILFAAFWSGGQIGERQRRLSAVTEISIVSPPFAPTLASVAASPSPIAQKRLFYPTTPEKPPPLEAQAALVADLLTGESYWELNPERRWPAASLVKLATAAYALQNIDLNSEIVIAADNFSPEAKENGTVKLRAGDVYRLDDLLRALLLASSNEAGEAIANFYGRQEFIRGLEKMAAGWGADVNFADPTGLAVANQASARDWRIIAAEIYVVYPAVFEITRSRKAVITELRSGRRETILGTNPFAGEKWFLGGKTGYTDEAGGNLLTLAVHQGRAVAIVVLGSSDRFGDTEKLLSWFQRVYRLEF